MTPDRSELSSDKAETAKLLGLSTKSKCLMYLGAVCGPLEVTPMVTEYVAPKVQLNRSYTYMFNIYVSEIILCVVDSNLLIYCDDLPKKISKTL